MKPKMKKLKDVLTPKAMKGMEYMAGLLAKARVKMDVEQAKDRDNLRSILQSRSEAIEMRKKLQGEIEQKKSKE
ncbi:MAG: hypothetical protein JST43_09465 [Bacteroidetes bacterium]|nr:hypothetical protein [Bacteroidota bacterium]MBS1539074.1 hypothetical protein [Bacteroidota bacterium]